MTTAREIAERIYLERYKLGVKYPTVRHLVEIVESTHVAECVAALEQEVCSATCSHTDCIRNRKALALAKGEK